MTRPRAPSRGLRHALAALLLFAAAPVHAAATTPDSAAADLAAAEARYFQELKRLEWSLVHEGARAEMRERAELRNLRGRRLTRALGERGRRPVPKVDAPALPARGVRHVPESRARARFLGAAPDRRVNDRFSDLTPSATQSEVSIVALGLHQVAAWNDAEWRFQEGPIGFAWSADGGETWVDGGAPPLSATVRHWESDPVLAVDEKTGEFTLCAMAVTAPPPANAVVIARGRFQAGAFAWDPPIAVRSVRDTFPDKPWIAADSASGNLYVSYTTFFSRDSVSTDQIEFQRSTDGGRTWSPPAKLSADRDDGLVQGSRPLVGPRGEIEVVWGAVDTTRGSGGLDYKRARRSEDGGATFRPEATVCGLYSNFGSGAPGFNRGSGFDFPSAAFDRSDGPHRGRVYVAWQEGLDYWDDYPSAPGAAVVEVESASVLWTPFSIGDVVRGAIASRADADAFRFHGPRGASVIFYVDSLDASLNLELRLLCSDGATRMAYNAPTWRGRPRALVWTLPESGDYVLRFAVDPGGSGGYRMRTGWVAQGPERARDHRDVFVTHSDDGLHWSEPVRMNHDAPWYDDWLPELAVSARGNVYAAWYDWRDTPSGECGASSSVYLARSSDGGERWEELGALTDQVTPWSEVGSDLKPNQGDYIALFAGAGAIAAAWSDGRDGDPDVYAARVDLSDEPPPFVAVALRARVTPNPAGREFVVELSLTSDAPARLDVLDLAGRRVRSIPVPPGAGRRSVRVDTGAPLASGVYFARVSQAGRMATARFVVVR